MGGNPMDMTGRTILVTGASSGIGRAACILLSRLNARLVLIGRDTVHLAETLEALAGGGHIVAPFDLADTEAIPTWMKTLEGVERPMQGLVHCAGIQTVRPLQFMKMDDFDRTIDINVRSAFALTKGFRQKTVGAGDGSIVFLSSIMAVVGQRGVSAYCASKGALAAMTRALALELAPMRVNCVAPAVVQTPMTEKFKSQLTDEQFAEVVRMHPLGLGNALDVAHAIAFLLADTARWITGTTLVVDGGYSAH
ncbi:MAG: SDR family NAD(P)-dependent oxidoreductase [Desulfobacteraceae bacterium]|nr:SDR family NAD(P)-dependent oxidoreductase [Desulfobacteraceae bacterium]